MAAQIKQPQLKNGKQTHRTSADDDDVGIMCIGHEKSFYLLYAVVGHSHYAVQTQGHVGILPAPHLP